MLNKNFSESRKPLPGLERTERRRQNIEMKIQKHVGVKSEKVLSRSTTV